MDKNSDGKIILALETALDGGSVSVLKSGKQIDCALGAGELSKSEDILPIIDKLLEKNGIDKKEIGLIAVSDGPGSLTGLRIGLAIARGLGDSLAAEVCQISVLEAMTYQINLEGGVLSALYTERSGVFYREFSIRDGQRETCGEVVQISEVIEFVHKLGILKGEKVVVVLNKNLKRLLTSHAENLKEISFFTVEGNPAEAIGSASAIKCV